MMPLRTEIQAGENEKQLTARNVTAWYGNFAALRNITVDIPSHAITALIGPSGCGKSTFLRLFNRMNDLIDGFRVEGELAFNGKNIYGREVDVAQLRKEIGMVFQKPNPFPKSIFENVVYGLKIQGIRNRGLLEERAENALRLVGLWEEVRDNLKKSAMALSGGQQQRLCIARVIAVEPSVILMDEPTSALDPIATARIEELINELKRDYTIVIVTHNMQQAARVSAKTGFFYMGELVEFDETEIIFTNPKEEKTQNYITGRFG